ncbi:MAG: ribosomal RNA small subunit methyltransferase A [candidate division Zixibacteria bacterium]|nr:ribosomal RNA small subunit methyltransferase A [candidate division Zixibacteria bacterium]
MSPYRAKKRLGQNFLVDNQVAARIVKAIEPQPGDHVVEIGPGKGALTEHLINADCLVTAIEFDRDLIPLLTAKFADDKNIIIIAKDFLKITPDELPERMKIIGNLPFNISTAVMEKLFEFRQAIQSAVFTVQAEVAKRLTADPKSRDYGSLTVIMAAGFDIETLFDIGAKGFRPMPAVSSSVVKLVPADRIPADFESFTSFIRGCFRQKRKTLCNSMQLGLNIPKYNCEDLIKRAGCNDGVRPEQLSFDDYTRLYDLWRDIQR